MRLFYAPRSPFGIKVRIAIQELGLQDVELVQADPWTDEALRRFNPLCKIPTLVLDDGFALYDSPVICEYLNDVGRGRLIPQSGVRRWQALRRQALGDGLAQAVVRRFVERIAPVGQRAETVARRQEHAIDATLGALEIEAGQLSRLATVGEIAIAAALMYLTFRSPEIAWQESRPTLATWFDEVSGQASVLNTRIAAL